MLIEVRPYVLFEFESPPSASTLAWSYVLQMLIEYNTWETLPDLLY